MSSKSKIEDEITATTESLTKARENVEQLIKAILDDYGVLTTQIQSEVESQDISQIEEEKIESLRIDLENRLLSQASYVKETF